MDILDPAGSAIATSRALAPRPPSLDGAVVGVLDNSKPNARVLLERVAGALKDRFGARAVRVWRKAGASGPAAAGAIEEIVSACGVILTGSAD